MNKIEEIIKLSHAQGVHAALGAYEDAEKLQVRIDELIKKQASETSDAIAQIADGLKILSGGK